MKSVHGMIRWLTPFFLGSLASGVLWAATDLQPLNEHRVALVIGNAKYQESPLKNPVNDAKAIRAKLEDLGFDVVYYEDLKIKQIGTAMREFRNKIKPGSVAAVFYAGHGLQVKGENYLPAIDAEMAGEEDVPQQSIRVNSLLDVMADSKSRLNLVMLDACRNNPFTRRFRSAAGGLAKVDSAASGTLIHFATKPGSVAADGDGANGLYTSHLLAAIDQTGVPIEKVLKDTGAAVKRASAGRQEPWSEGGIEGEFFFRPPGVLVSSKADKVRDLLLKSTEAYRARDFKKSIALSNQLLELQPTEVAALGNKTVALVMLNRLPEAAQAADEAVRINPSYGPGYNNRGIVLERQGRVADAKRDFASGCKLNDDRACRNELRLLGK